MGLTYTQLTEEQRGTIRQYLLARPFTEREREYWKLSWIFVNQATLDSINALMPPNHVVNPRKMADGSMYINLDLLSDASEDGHLAALLPTLETMTWEHIDPWEWPPKLDEDGNVIPREQPDQDVPAWRQPLGSTDALAQGAKVFHKGKIWESTTPANVWEPGISGWREVVTDGYPEWVQPTGAHDAYPLGAIVTHSGKTWENTGSDANVWEPGVFGWTEIV